MTKLILVIGAPAVMHGWRIATQKGETEDAPLLLLLLLGLGILLVIAQWKKK